MRSALALASLTAVAAPSIAPAALVPIPSDPIFAAIAEARTARAEFFGWQSGEDLPDELGHRYARARAELQRTVPTTPAGLAALTGFFREVQQVEWECDTIDPIPTAFLRSVDDAVRGMGGLKPWSPGPVPPSETDAKLIALAERCIAAEREFHAACDVRSIAEEAEAGTDRPRRRRPKVLRVLRSDADLGIPIMARRGERWYDREFTVGVLREERWWTGEFERIRTDDYHGSIERCFTPSRAARARADEIIAAFDAWAPEEHKPTADQIRAFEEADRKSTLAGKRANALQDELAAMKAKTLSGVEAKARAVQAQWPGTELNEDEGPLDCKIVASIVADLLRLAQRHAAA